jgi:branched-chain amino acid transport system permease protein
MSQVGGEAVGLTLGLVLQVLISGLAAGAVYALLGIGYSLIYRMTGVLNFAHGDLVSLAIFSFLFVLGGGGLVSVVQANATLLAIAIVVAIVVSALFASVLREAVVEPFTRRQSVLGWVAGTVAAGLLLRSVLSFWFTGDSYSAPDVLPIHALGLPDIVPLGGGATLQVRTVVILVVALLLALILDLWLTYSITGRAMRASAEAPAAARLVGISPRRLQATAWVIAGVLIAVAGLLIAPTRPLSITLGVILGLKGIAAAVIGRLGSARGAVVAGLGIGLVESIVTNLWVPAISLGAISMPQLGPAPALHDVLPLLALVLVLALAPRRLTSAPAAVE